METQPEYGFREHFTQILGDMAKGVSERPGETKQQQLVRSQAAVFTIMSMLPRDAIEAMLAGHCLMFHELLTDSIHNTLRGELDTTRRATRSGIVAMDRAFGSNLERLERYQSRPAEGRRDTAQEKPAQTAEAIAPALDIVPAATAVFREPAAATPREPTARAAPPRATSVPATARTAAPVQGAAGVANPAITAFDARVTAAFTPDLGANPPTVASLAVSAAKIAVPDRRTLLNGVSHFASQSTAFTAIPMNPAARNSASAISHSAGGRQLTSR